MHHAGVLSRLISSLFFLCLGAGFVGGVGVGVGGSEAAPHLKVALLYGTVWTVNLQERREALGAFAGGLGRAGLGWAVEGSGIDEEGGG